MAEFILKDMVQKAGRAADFQIDSAATSTEEIGNPVYPPARRKLMEHGLGCAGKVARRMTGRDYDRYDLIIGMDGANLRSIRRICGGDRGNKIRLLLAYAGEERDVADPWYTRDFEAAWRDIEAGCRGLLRALGTERMER